jgi:hypothetical protein
MVAPVGAATFVYDSEGRKIDELVATNSNRIPITMDKIPQHLADAVVAIEDERFYSHNGVDIKRTMGAFFQYVSGDASYGGSTITQQLIKNITGEKDQSPLRKIRELARAINLEKQMEKELTKDPFNAADMKKLWSYSSLEDGTLELTSYKGSATTVYVPERIGKKAVTALGDSVFSPRQPNGTNKPAERQTALGQIHTIVIPDSVTTIGDEAFRWCTKLADAQGFVIVRNVLYSYHGSRKCVTIPDGVTTISKEAFFGCESLTSVTIPDSVTSIGKRAFDECSKLTIHASAGSYAETYAKAHNIPFTAK